MSPVDRSSLSATSKYSESAFSKSRELPVRPEMPEAEGIVPLVSVPVFEPWLSTMFPDASPSAQYAMRFVDSATAHLPVVLRAPLEDRRFGVLHYKVETLRLIPRCLGCG